MNKEQLTPEQQEILNEFVSNLAKVDGPNDMFPPDYFSNDFEPRNPICPSDSDSQAKTFAPVYDMVGYRKHRVDKLKSQLGELMLV